MTASRRTAPHARALFSAQPDDTGPLPTASTSTTPAAWRWSPRCAAAPATTSSTHALTALRNLDHRGADRRRPRHRRRRGHLSQIPDAFLRAVVDFDLPDRRRVRRRPGFLPRDADGAPRRGGASRRSPRRRTSRSSAGVTCRSTADNLGGSPATCMPHFEPALRLRARGAAGERRASASTGSPSACASAPSARPTPTSPSLSSRTLVYKGMLTTAPARAVLPRPVATERFASELALVHSRFSTNTFPSWPLAQPFRMHRPQRRDQHRQGQPQLDARPRVRSSSPTHPRRPRARCFPICTPGASDSASLRRGARAAAPRRPHRCRTRC